MSALNPIGVALDRHGTHLQVKDLAIQLAAKFYEDTHARKPGFHKVYRSAEDYINGRKTVHFGTIHERKIQERANWLHHVVLARRVLVALLAQYQKMGDPESLRKADVISDALLAEAQASAKHGKNVKRIAQARHR